MDRRRVQLGSLLEWLVAAALVVLVLAAGSVFFREVRGVRAVVPVIAGEAREFETLPGIPPRAVQVPILLLPNGPTIQVGDRASEVTARLAGIATATSDLREGGARGGRLARFYSTADLQFVLVFDVVDDAAEPSVTAIYLR